MDKLQRDLQILLFLNNQACNWKETLAVFRKSFRAILSRLIVP